MRLGLLMTIPLALASGALATPDYTLTGTGDTTLYINGGIHGIVLDGTNSGVSSYSGFEAVYGEGYYRGVHGNSPSGLGVWGESNSSTGVYGQGGFVGVAADGGTYGVQASSAGGVGVTATGYDNAIYGEVTHVAPNTPAVKGYSPQGHGINGAGLIGVSGYSSGTVNNTYGVYGNANGSSNPYSTYGVYGTAYNGSTNWSGYFTGNVYVGGTFVNPSDIKFKKNVQPLNGGLQKVMALQPKTYDMKVEEFKGKVMLPEGNRYGLIAQELETVLPDLVHKVSAPAELPQPGSPEAKNYVPQPNTDFKSVDYISLIPILIAAIQEQQAEIDALKKAR